MHNQSNTTKEPTIINLCEKNRHVVFDSISEGKRQFLHMIENGDSNLVIAFTRQIWLSG